MEYIGIFLDDESKKKLMQFVPEESFKVFCDHITLIHKSQIANNLEAFEIAKSLVGKTMTVEAYCIGKSSKVIAIGVHCDESVNKQPHVTLCTLNKKGSPVQSNFIQDWKTIGSFFISGKVAMVE